MRMGKGTKDDPIIFKGDVESVKIGEYFLYEEHVFFLGKCFCDDLECELPMVFDAENLEAFFVEFSAVYRYFLCRHVGFMVEFRFEWDEEIEIALKQIGLGCTPQAFSACITLICERVGRVYDDLPNDPFADWPSMEQVLLN